MARRTYRTEYGDGSFHYSRTQGIWRGVVDLGRKPDGRRDRRYRTSKSKARAWDKFQALRKEVQIEALTRTGDGPALADWIDEWLSIREGSVRPKTIGSERSVLKWAARTIGRQRIGRLEPANMRTMCDAMAEAGRSGTYQAYAVRIVKQLLHDARAEGYTVPDTVLAFAGPKHSANTREDIPLEDVARILQTARDHEDYTRWLAALLQGIRQGEALGLRWSSIDFDEQLIYVDWQLQELNRDETGTGYNLGSYSVAIQLHGAHHLVPPKTASARRVIPLVPGLAGPLLEHRARQQSSPHDLVWPSLARPGQPRTAREDRETWDEIQAEAGVYKITPDGTSTHYVVHEARHTAATLLMAAGVDESVRIAILGHSSAVSTRRYTHADITLARAALLNLSRTLAIDS